MTKCKALRFYHYREFQLHNSNAVTIITKITIEQRQKRTFYSVWFHATEANIATKLKK